MNIAASITDFPLQTPVETFFRKYKEIGIDSVEIVFGAKLLYLEKIFALSKKYSLPITSFHQSPWSGFGFSIDELLIKKAAEYGVKVFTFHPLAFVAFDTKIMHRYFSSLQKLQEKYDVTICLENMPNEIVYKPLYTGGYSTVERHLEKVYLIATEYNLSLTYDTSHTQYSHPHEENIFQKIFPKIKNIHLSSFTESQEHLPLDKGNLDTEGFLAFLTEEKYNGLITFEINHSLTKRIFARYDFSEVQRSREIVTKIFGR